MQIDLNEQFQKAQDIILNQDASMDELSAAFDIFTAFQNMRPRDPSTMFGLATTCARRKQYAMAVLLYEIYLKIESEPYKQGGAYLNIGQIYHDDGKKEISIGYFKKAVECCEGVENEDAEYTLRAANINIAGSALSTGKPEAA